MANDSIIDTEILIGEVEQKPNLWDSSNEEYKNRDLRQNSWDDIGKIVIDQFNNLLENEKKTIVEKLQKRWKTARNAFIRCRAKGKTLKSGAAAKKQSKYIYYDNLKFLEKTLDLNSTQTNLENQIDEKPKEVEYGELDTEVDQSEGVVQVERAERTKRKQKSNKLEDSLIRFLDRNQNPQFDEDKFFLDSLLPSLKKLNDEQKLEFRIGALNLIKKIANSLPTIPQPEYPIYNQKTHYSNNNNYSNRQWSSGMTVVTPAVLPLGPSFASGACTPFPLSSCSSQGTYQSTIGNESECEEYTQFTNI